ncbi:pseudouridylate synthase [Hoylesella saccharolytica]|jgi:hypothetical protein|uniref:pseudouridylate synthase n=1 Tax=Hoylesella saccharolytica TaxID=633701 RepID=UPI0023560261|nr:pseudouridylate synthase [Hoylesella saccharolytica]
MLEFTNLIRVEPLSSENKVYELMANTFSYIPQSSDNDSGNYWNCDKTIVIDLPDAATRKFFSIERNAIVTIKASDGRSFSIGTKEVPARVQISSNLTSANLIIKCKMLKDPLL